MPYRGLILFAAFALIACASGPHPALQVASSDLDCEQSGMKLHKIYPKKVRIEGCGQEAIYVDACDGYGVEANCGWGRQYATQFERDAAKRAKAERAEAKKQQAAEAKADGERAQREAAEREAAERAAEKEEAAAKEAERKNAEQEKATAKKAEEEEAEEEEAKPKAATKKPAKKSESIDDFLK